MFSRLARPVINSTRTMYGRDQAFNLLVDKRKYFISMGIPRDYGNPIMVSTFEIQVCPDMVC